MKSVLIASVVAATVYAEIPPPPSPSVESIAAKHLEMAKAYNGSAVRNSSLRESGGGSVVFTYHTDYNTCESKASSGIGYVFGGCYTIKGLSGMYYSDCTDNGSEVIATLNTCASRDCSSECTAVQLPIEKCSQGTKVACSQNADSFTEYDEFTYHFE